MNSIVVITGINYYTHNVSMPYLHCIDRGPDSRLDDRSRLVSRLRLLHCIGSEPESRLALSVRSARCCRALYPGGRVPVSRLLSR